MSETTLGEFAKRQLDQEYNTARAGLRMHLQKIRTATSYSLSDMDNGLIPSADLTDGAAQVAYWLTKLSTVSDLRAMLEADREP